VGRRVLVYGWINFFFHDRRVKNGPTLQQFWGMPQEHQEIPLSIAREQIGLTKSGEKSVAADRPAAI
jgi:anaerobic magnesium-protoporphyrin IX monomethyl ester cyclase